MRMNRRRKSARISVQERLKTPGKPCAYQPRRHSGLLEQTVAHRAAGRAGFEINIVRRGRVNDVVIPTDHARLEPPGYADHIRRCC